MKAWQMPHGQIKPLRVHKLNTWQIKRGRVWEFCLHTLLARSMYVYVYKIGLLKYKVENSLTLPYERSHSKRVFKELNVDRSDQAVQKYKMCISTIK